MNFEGNYEQIANNRKCCNKTNKTKCITSLIDFLISIFRNCFRRSFDAFETIVDVRL